MIYVLLIMAFVAMLYPVALFLAAIPHMLDEDP